MLRLRQDFTTLELCLLGPLLLRGWLYQCCNYDMDKWLHPRKHATNSTGTCNSFNTLRLRQDGRLFADDVFKTIFFDENIWILTNSSLRFVPKGQINYIPALVQIMAWRRPSDKPLSEPTVVSLPTHICVIRPQWVKSQSRIYSLLRKLNFKFALACWQSYLYISKKLSNYEVAILD